jgi:putative endopeptidase
MSRLILTVLSSLFILSSCNEAKKEEAGVDFLASNIDSTYRPGNDFFLYANNGWFSKNPIPASEQSNGLWQIIRDTINAQIRQICEDAASQSNEPKGSAKQKIGDMYFSGMDSANINAKGISVIQIELDQIDAITDGKGLSKAAALVHTVSGAPMFSLYVSQDDRISSKYAIFINQGGLSMPERSFYFDNDARATMIRGKFLSHLNNMFSLLGYDSLRAKKASQNMMKLETDLARISRKKEDTRDPLKNYNKISFQTLSQSTPAWDWSIFLSETGLTQVDTVIVGQPEFLKGWNGFLNSYSLDVWKDYLKYHLVRGLAPYLDDKTMMEHFSFYSATLRGIERPRPRWKRVTDQTNNSLGELIGQVYVSEYLPKGTKEKLQEIGNAVRAVYAGRIRKLDWMSESTKIKALRKLETMVMKVGYPDKWKDMSKLELERSSYARNVMSANKWDFNYMINKFGKPVDRTEWSMYPQTYNAYYNPSNNEIVVPGCNIIVPGYERKMADDAILYSIIGGSTFGHEMTHGFDDQGSKYDEMGNLNNWWTSDDSARFHAKTKSIVEQFNQFIAVDSLHINGELTQGENIADLGGIMMGYEAFQKTNQYKEKQNIAGLDPDKRFFLGYALAWMINDRPESIANQVKSDEHSPAKFRVIGPLVNMPEFYTAFKIKNTDALYRPDSLRIKIW